jgi:hypothetical protein
MNNLEKRTTSDSESLSEFN